jgi:hypothetical protein
MAEKYGVEALTALPPLASSYRASRLEALLPWRRQDPPGGEAAGPDPPPDETAKVA